MEGGEGLICILPHGAVQLDQRHLWKMLSFIKWSWRLYHKSGVHNVDLCLSLQLDSIDKHICVCANAMLFLLLLLCNKLKIGGSDTFCSSFICRVVLTILGLCFHMQLKIVPSRSVKNCVGVLIRIALHQ